MKHSLIFFYAFALITIMPSCANIIPPGGGPRDSLPPRLMTALPKDSALNVRSKNIQLTFDEFVTLQNIPENLIVSPVVKNTPVIDYKLRNVSIRFKDSLEANTTYTINFGNAIVDVNEGNITRDFSYVFSTGNSIDQHTYRGRVLLAETGKPDSTLIVVLHPNLSDTAVMKNQPRYYTRISGKGEFQFRNLPPGKFAAYVLPNDFTKRYDDSTKYFAFLDAPVTIDSNTPPDTLYAFEEIKRKARTTAPAQPAAAAKSEDKRLKYQSRFDNGRQDLLSDLQLSFTRKITILDTAGIRLCDTSYQPVKGYTVSLDSSGTKLHIAYPWKEYTPFRLLLARESVADSAGLTIGKADTIGFYTQRQSEYGSFRIRFGNVDLSANPVLQFVQNDAITESFILKQPELVRKLYKPGSYDIRILYDTNENGVWDTGNFKTRRQPEKVLDISRQFNIRANWDNEITISL